jgi:hypothetical protein
MVRRSSRRNVQIRGFFAQNSSFKARSSEETDKLTGITPMHVQTSSFLSCRAAFLPYYSTSTLKAKILGHVFFVKESMWFAAAHTQRAIFERPLCANTWGPYSPPPHQAGIHFASRLISPTKAFEKCQIRE